MPRIPNWNYLDFFRPGKHIESVFKDVIDWNPLERPVPVVVFIKMGEIILATLVNSNSKKNQLYQSFQEIRRIIRTIFLLQYISDMKLREQNTASTNKVEAYNEFSKWLFFGGEGIITEKNPIEQEK